MFQIVENVVMSIKREYFEVVNGCKKRVVDRVCDCCNAEERASYYVVMKGRKTHPGKDYCRVCGRKNRGATIKGKLHGNFKHGLSSHGYKRISIDGHRVYEHIYIIEEAIGRKLKNKESVHHIDLNKQNNDIENLFICNNENEHQIIHYQLEEIGYLLLNKNIWFDKDNFLYVNRKIKRDTVENCNVRKAHRYISVHNKKRGTKAEYIILPDENGNRTVTKLFHVYLIELKIGRKLYCDECVHHIDGNSLNNNLSNLILIKKRTHKLCHFSLQHAVCNFLSKGDLYFDRLFRKYIYRGNTSS